MSLLLVFFNNEENNRSLTSGTAGNVHMQGDQISCSFKSRLTLHVQIITVIREQ